MYFTERQLANFWKKVDKGDGTGCWEWTGALNSKGYGNFGIDGRMMLSHRLSWIMANGDIENDGSYHGTCVLHHCDNPKCVRPDHLFIGSHRDNMEDMADKHRATGGGRRGTANGYAKLTDQQVIEIREKWVPRTYSQTRLGREYGVSATLISQIVTRKIWTHI